MAVIIGVKDLVTAEVNVDSSTALTYKTIEEVPDLVEVSVEDITGDAEIQYADDVEKYRVNKTAKMRISITLLSYSKETEAAFFGHTVSANGELVKKNSDQAPYRAFGFKAEDGAGKFDGVWLTKCIPTKRTTGTKTYRTKEGEKITVQTLTVEFEAIPTVKTGIYLYETNSGLTAMQTKWKTWFDTVPGATA